MKKFVLVVLLVVLGSLSLFASKAMREELLYYWDMKNIETRVNSGNGVMVTPSGNIIVALPDNSESVVFAFSLYSETEDFEYFLKDRTMLPYNSEFRLDFLKKLSDFMDYQIDHGYFPGGKYVWLDTYYVLMQVTMDNKYIYVLLY